jgi:hypothetical protein
MVGLQARFFPFFFFFLPLLFPDGTFLGGGKKTTGGEGFV